MAKEVSGSDEEGCESPAVVARSYDAKGSGAWVRFESLDKKSGAVLVKWGVRSDLNPLTIETYLHHVSGAGNGYSKYVHHAHEGEFEIPAGCDFQLSVRLVDGGVRNITVKNDGVEWPKEFSRSKPFLHPRN